MKTIDEHPRLKEHRQILEDEIKSAISNAISNFEDKIGLWVTDIECKYHKDQRMESNDVKATMKPFLTKGMH